MRFFLALFLLIPSLSFSLTFKDGKQVNEDGSYMWEDTLITPQKGFSFKNHFSKSSDDYRYNLKGIGSAVLIKNNIKFCKVSKIHIHIKFNICEEGTEVSPEEAMNKKYVYADREGLLEKAYYKDVAKNRDDFVSELNEMLGTTSTNTHNIKITQSSEEKKIINLRFCKSRITGKVFKVEALNLMDCPTGYDETADVYNSVNYQKIKFCKELNTGVVTKFEGMHLWECPSGYVESTVTNYYKYNKKYLENKKNLLAKKNPSLNNVNKTNISEKNILDSYHNTQSIFFIPEEDEIIYDEEEKEIISFKKENFFKIDISKLNEWNNSKSWKSRYNWPIVNSDGVKGRIIDYGSLSFTNSKKNIYDDNFFADGTLKKPFSIKLTKEMKDVQYGPCFYMPSLNDKDELAYICDPKIKSLDVELLKISNKTKRKYGWDGNSFTQRYKVKFDTGKEGWVQIEDIDKFSLINGFINNSDAPKIFTYEDFNQKYIVNASPLNIRWEPNGEWKSIISKGEKVAAMEFSNNNEWAYVVSKDGQTGWVSTKYLLYDGEENNYQVENKSSKTDTAKKTKEIIIPKNIPEVSNDDNAGPIINCNQTEYRTTENFIKLKCQIKDDSEIYKVFVNGNEIKNNLSNFEFKIENIPLDSSTYEVIAFDKMANQSQQIISVQRDFNYASVNLENNLKPLISGKIKHKNSSNRIALIIGIKSYQDIPNTQFGDKDAMVFVDFARDNLNIKENNIKYLFNEDARFFEIKKLNQWLKTKINSKTEVFIFYSGHGANNEGESLLLPSDFSPDLIADSSFTKKGFLNDMVNQYKPNHIYAFFDACFSGLGREGEQLIAGLRNITIAEEEVIQDNISVFNSASGAEFSNDLPEAKHGLFSYYLMKGLEGDADSNSDKKITSNELHSFIQENVSNKAIEIGRKQNPSYLGDNERIILEW